MLIAQQSFICLLAGTKALGKGFNGPFGHTGNYSLCIIPSIFKLNQFQETYKRHIIIRSGLKVKICIKKRFFCAKQKNTCIVS